MIALGKSLMASFLHPDVSAITGASLFFLFPTSGLSHFFHLNGLQKAFYQEKREGPIERCEFNSHTQQGNFVWQILKTISRLSETCHSNNQLDSWLPKPNSLAG